MASIDLNNTLDVLTLGTVPMDPDTTNFVAEVNGQLKRVAGTSIQASGGADTLQGYKAEDFAIWANINYIVTVPSKRKLWRGKDLGDHVTDAQWAEIKAGTFNDLFVGDYWIINDIVWRIMDIDYWLNLGAPACTKHHLIIMPDNRLAQGAMNDTDTTSTGYINSKMNKSNLDSSVIIINNAFGDNHILGHSEYLIDSSQNGIPYSGNWYNEAKILLPSEIMIFGSYIFTPGSDGSISPNRKTINTSQLAGMSLHPPLINGLSNRVSYWLRDVVNNTDFAYVNATGSPDRGGASLAGLGIRPVFGIK